jgi:hypothetical protein
VVLRSELARFVPVRHEDQPRTEAFHKILQAMHAIATLIVQRVKTESRPLTLVAITFEHSQLRPRQRRASEQVSPRKSSGTQYVACGAPSTAEEQDVTVATGGDIERWVVIIVCRALAAISPRTDAASME